MQKRSEPKERIIMGIDPGTQVLGFGVVSTVGQSINVLQYGVLKLSKADSHTLRLERIFQKITELINEFTPDELAIEAPFYGKNAQSMLKLGRVQGVVMAAALRVQLSIAEYSPKSVKQSVTGNGNATKLQVAYMLEKLVGITLNQDFLDATDAIAIAICHHFQGGNTLPGKIHGSSKSWSAFIKENPRRIS